MYQLVHNTGHLIGTMVDVSSVFIEYRPLTMWSGYIGMHTRLTRCHKSAREIHHGT